MTSDPWGQGRRTGQEPRPPASVGPMWVPSLALAAFVALGIAAGGFARPAIAAEAANRTGADGGAGQPAAAAAPWKVFRDPKLGIEFSYPATARIVPGCLDEKNCIAMVGNKAPAEDYILAFEVFDGALDTVAVNNAVFQKEGERWVAKGRGASRPAEPIAGPGWRGLKAVVDCGASDSAGFHASAGECLWVVISNGKTSVVADTQGTVPVGPEILRAVQSLRFIAR